MRNVLLFLLCIIGLTGAAQHVRVSGEVSNALTQQPVVRAAVKLFGTDSVAPLAADTTLYKFITERNANRSTTYADKHSGAVFSLVVPAEKEYRLVVMAEGFEEFSCRVEHEAGKSQVTVPPIYLIPARERKLDEVVVKATRIKMFYKGDTIVYNADAFNVTQTESLRRLVEQLPGAELIDGEIRVNGKRVDNLLISGKNFFQGNIQAALDNLPAFIVSRIKVYDKAGEKSELTGRDMHDESYVMDVHLKREYIGTWMAKLSADGGTDRLWGGQGFLMRLDDRQMISVNAEINNFNQEREMEGMSNSLSVNPLGRESTKAVRVNYYYEPDKTWRLSAAGNVRRKDSRRQTRQNTETYLMPDNLMNRNENNTYGDDLKATASATLRARNPGRWQHSLTYLLNYSSGRTTGDSRSISYYFPAKGAWADLSIDSIIRLEETDPAGNDLLNSLMDMGLSRSHRFNHSPKWESSLVFGSDMLSIRASLIHETSTRRDFSNYHLTTYADASSDRRRRLKDLHDYLLDFDSRLEWVHQYERPKLFNGVVKPYIRFSHRYGTASHPEYRLERMTDWSDGLPWDIGSLGQLPPVEWHVICLDEANSYFSTERKDEAEAGLDLSHRILLDGSSLQVEANEAVSYRRRILDYERGGHTYHPQRRGFLFNPSLTLRWKGENRQGRARVPELELRYSGRSSLPELLQLLPIRDDSDPLNRFVGDADLRNSFRHNVSATYRLQDVRSRRMFNFNANYSRTLNAISTLSVYDPTTGIRTYQPVNTSRNHTVAGRTDFSTPLGPKQRFTISASFSADYNQTENLSFIAEGSASGHGLIRNLGLTPSLSLNGMVAGLYFNGRWSTVFRHVSQQGRRERYRQTMLSGTFSYRLPWNIQLNSNILTKIFTGSPQASDSFTEINWDASLEKFILDNRIGFRLLAHDILSQSTSYLSTVTTTGYVESYTDVLPRYLMLTVSYNFKWTEKKK